MNVERSKFNLDFLRRRRTIHDLHEAGWENGDIARRMGMTDHQIRRLLRMSKPNLRTVRSDYGWRQLAACSGMDTNRFFPTSRGLGSSKIKDRAKQVCSGCPVRRQCRDDAIDHYENEGIWGGEDFTLYRYVYDEQTGNITVLVKVEDGAFKKVS